MHETKLRPFAFSRRISHEISRMQATTAHGNWQSIARLVFRHHVRQQKATPAHTEVQRSVLIHFMLIAIKTVF